MAKLNTVIAYLLKMDGMVPIRVADLTKLVYMADWKSAIDYDQQITSIEWASGCNGPNMAVILKTIEDDPNFAVISSKDPGGIPVHSVRLDNEPDFGELTKEDRKTLDHVIKIKNDVEWDIFVRLVYSTYPMATQPRNTRLNLVELANIYKSNRSSFETP